MEPGTPNDDIKLPRIETGPEQNLVRSIENGKVAVAALTDFAISKGVDKQRLAFTEKIFDGNAFLMITDRQFNQAYQKIRGLTEEQAANIGAITDRSSGNIFMRESTTGKTHYVIHEAIHRAMFLARKTASTPRVDAQLAGDYFLTIGEKGKLEVSEELKEIFSGEPVPDFVGFVGQLAKDVEEGFVEWAARKGEELAALKGTPIPIERSDHAYPLHVEVVDSIQEKIISGLGCKPEKAQSILIETALTGDLTMVREALGGNFREAMKQFIDHPRGDGAVHIDY